LSGSEAANTYLFIKMTSSTCASCLLRLRASSKLKLHSPSTSLLATKSFHTTAPQFDVVKKKSGPIQQKKFRESTSAKTKKKRREKPKLPEVGERKALRKRIVLSNTNTLEIPGMEDMTPQNMTDVGHIGQMLGLEGALLDQLREAKAFKPTQNWNMFRRPATLVRKETVALGINVQEVNDSSNGEGTGAGLGAMTLQQIIAGERSTGKSLLLLQAMSMAYLNNWVVLNVPEGTSPLLSAHPTVKLTWRKFSPRIHNWTILVCSTTRIRKIRARATICPATDDLKPPFTRGLFKRKGPFTFEGFTSPQNSGRIN
jgi:Mitochondrial ribosomal death-associated protein 3